MSNPISNLFGGLGKLIGLENKPAQGTSQQVVNLTPPQANAERDPMMQLLAAPGQPQNISANPAISGGDSKLKAEIQDLINARGDAMSPMIKQALEGMVASSDQGAQASLAQGSNNDAAANAMADAILQQAFGQAPQIAMAGPAPQEATSQVDAGLGDIGKLLAAAMQEEAKDEAQKAAAEKPKKADAPEPGMGDILSLIGGAPQGNQAGQDPLAGLLGGLLGAPAPSTGAKKAA